ncbi:hypothetical protein ACFUCQ_19630 [Streptomyces sp. NPDC057197]|uniref:hypothetical protein n=1 Tax=unclassified Streptomyces TaxID=2593676 RepID=UPI0009A10A53|nr:hypothetical protein [Streptomyces sp. SAT1]
MSTLMRAPRPCGSWFWDLVDVHEPGLEAALRVAACMAEVLKKFELLNPVRLEYDWFVLGAGPTGVTSSLLIPVTPLSDHKLAERVLGSRPVSFPDAEMDDLRVIGSGTWITSEGAHRQEPRLVELSVSSSPLGPTAEVAVHYDIWSWFDFSGHPHPEIYNRNAPRLADALQGISSVLGVTPETGDATYFGHAMGNGISTPDAYDDGLGPDLTDKL